MKEYAFNHMPMCEEGVKEIFAWIDKYVHNYREIAEKIILGKSEDGKWEVPAVVVTNKAIPREKKLISIVTSSRHGQEKGTRVIGPEILNYLASEKAAETRDKQIVVVVPIVNPEGVVLNEFHSSLYGITEHEKNIFAYLCSRYTPDMMIDYHSLGEIEGARCDLGDMEAIIPANTTKWGMDEQIYQSVSNRLMEAAASEGWPYEIHTMEDLSNYYFGDAGSGKMPHRYMQEKVFLLHIQDQYEQYSNMTYTNYTNGPAYLKWHTLVFGVEINHWSIGIQDGLAESGAVITRELLNIGNQKPSWQKYSGYPTDILVGDFRMSIRATGKNPEERRVSREKIWNERAQFDVLKRVMKEDRELTTAEVGYMGNTPLEIDLCLRMRQNVIKQVFVEDQEVDFETFKDNCSTFLSIPIMLKKAGRTKVKVVHEHYKKNDG